MNLAIVFGLETDAGGEGRQIVFGPTPGLNLPAGSCPDADLGPQYGQAPLDLDQVSGEFGNREFDLVTEGGAWSRGRGVDDDGPVVGEDAGIGVPQIDHFFSLIC